MSRYYFDNNFEFVYWLILMFYIINTKLDFNKTLHLKEHFIIDTTFNFSFSFYFLEYFCIFSCIYFNFFSLHLNFIL